MKLSNRSIGEIQILDTPSSGLTTPDPSEYIDPEGEGTDKVGTREVNKEGNRKGISTSKKGAKGIKRKRKRTN